MRSALIRPTTRSQPEPLIDETTEDWADMKRSGAVDPGDPEPRNRTRRAASAASGEETKGRKINMPDSVFARLQLTAIQQRKTISAIANDILDQNLPKLSIKRDG